jgi:glycosyltransferase involved in cell wall biosynthesis
MKIMYLCSRLSPTGPINQLYNIINHINSIQFDTYIVTLSKEEPNSRASEFEAEGCEISTLNVGSVPNPITVLRKYRGVIRRIDPDIIHSHGFRADLLSSFIPVSAKTVSTVHSYHYHHHPIEYGSNFGQIMAWLHVNSLKRIEKPVACSRSVSSKLQEHSVQSDVIQNGVCPTKFEPSKDMEKKSIRVDLGIKEDENVFISMGLNNRKDPMTVINGFKNASLNNSRLIMVSDGPLLEHCRQEVSDFPSIEVLGRVPAVEKYLQASDWFVSASRYEGFPMAVLEALSSGLPVCLSDIGPHREILEHDERAGILFSCGNQDELANVMKALLNDSHNIQNSVARNIIENELNSERMSVEYQNLYRDIIV